MSINSSNTLLTTPSRDAPIRLAELKAASTSTSNLDGFLSETDPKQALTSWLTQIAPVPYLKRGQDITLAINRAIAAIDSRISAQINAIIHHKRFQKLEASWRGLWYLATQCEGVRHIKLKVLDINWPEVTKDIDKALDFDQSQLFQKVYSEEYGHPGGEPYGAIIADYEVTHRPTDNHPYDDVTTLEGLAQIASASFSPLITGASPELFGVDDFAALGMPVDLEAVFRQEEYIRWRALRERADARFIGVALPRVLMRRPYRTQAGSYKGVPFREDLYASKSGDYLWASAAYAFGGVLLREFANVGWFGHIRGVPLNQIGGGLVTTLTVDRFATDDGDIAAKPLTDVIITDKRERELSHLGFVPLCQCYNTPFAAFYSNASLQKPSHDKETAPSVNAKLSAMLQHVLCGSRLAHYIKVMIRDKIGAFITARECEDFLRRWLFKYTTGREDLEWEEQARYPLREAAVQVTEHPERPGQYACVIHLVPHYQIDQMVSQLELITELVQTGQ